MADLAKNRKPVGARNRGTRNRAYTLPNRRDTRTPDLEVNAQVRGGNQSEAQKLASILGVASDMGNSIIANARENDAQNRQDDRTKAINDAMSGNDPDEGSKAYVNAYYGYQAQEKGIEAAQRADQRVTALLNDPDEDPDLEDIEAILNEEYRMAGLDEDGQPRFAGMPAAQRSMATVMADARVKIMGNSVRAIKTKQDEKLLQSGARTFITGLTTEPAVPQGAQGGDILTADPAPAKVDDGGPKLAANGGKPQPINSTGRLPFGDRSSITSDYAAHQARGSSGIDIDGKIGDPIEAPADGVIKTIGEDEKSGKYIIVSHGKDANGKEIVTTYSHLNDFNVEEGQTVAAGTKIAAMGNTGNVRSSGGGDGSHLHYRVKVGGSDVNPLTYNFEGTTDPDAPAIEGVETIDLEFATAQAEGATPSIDVEPYFDSLPPSVDMKMAKGVLIENLITAAQEQNRPMLLEGAAQSARADGTPSFNPTERKKLLDEAEAQRRNLRVKREREEAELHNTNIETLQKSIVNGELPSRSSVIEAVNANQLPARMGLWYDNYLDTEEERARIVKTREDQEAEAEEAARIDSTVAREAARLRLGGKPKQTRTELWEAFERGDFGTDEFGNPSVEALQRVTTLETARSRSASVRAQDPAVAGVVTTFEQTYRPAGGGSSNDPLAQYFGGGASQSGKPLRPEHYAYAMSLIEFEIEKGSGAHEAFRVAQKWAEQHVISETETVTSISDAELEAELRRLEGPDASEYSYGATKN